MTDVSDLAELLKTHAAKMAAITMRAKPGEEQSKLYRDMSTWMHGAAILMNAASTALTAAAQVRPDVEIKELRVALAEAIDTAFGTELNRQAVERLRELERLYLGRWSAPTEPSQGEDVLGMRKGEET